jgi:uncharacterized protein DUF6602
MNKHVENRLEAIQQSLLAHYQGGSGLPSALIGGEREHLLNEYLSKLLPPIYRFGSGAVTDATGELSGQLDVVMELPLGSNFPMPAGAERLYLAESVAAVIEVKSDISSQWSQVQDAIRKVKILRRDIRQSSAILLESSPEPIIEAGPKIPCYAVGYHGYRSLEALQDRLSATPIESRPDGVLVLESGCFLGVSCKADGVWGLYAFVAELIAQVNSVLQIAYPDLYSYGEIKRRDE